MARVLGTLVFSALLTLLSTQAAVPSAHVVSAFAIVWSAEAERQAPRKVRRAHVQTRAVLPEAPPYVSRKRPAPPAPFLFQRPPPVSFPVA